MNRRLLEVDTDVVRGFSPSGEKNYCKSTVARTATLRSF